MNSWGRKFVAVLAGVLVAGALVAMVEFLGQKLYPLPPGVDLRDQKALAGYAESMPMEKMLLVFSGWALGTFAGAWLAARIAGRIGVAHVVGGIFFAATVANFMLIPHPIWMLFVVILLIPVCAHFGGRLALRGRSLQ